MNFPLYLAKRITKGGNRNYSKLIIKVAVAGIMLGLAVMILAIAVLKGFKGEIINKERGFNGDITVYKHNLNSSYESSPFSLNDDSLELLTKVPGVKQLNAFGTKPGIINANNEIEGVVLKGIDSNYNQKLLESILVEGKTIDFSDSIPAQQQILISKYTANRLDLKLGDDFLMYFVQEPLRKRKFTIVGIYNLGVEEIDKTYVISDISLIRRLNKWEKNEVGGYEIITDDFDKLDITNQTVLDFLPIQLVSVTISEQYPEIFEWLALLDINSQIILVLMVLVAIINMISALLIMILERTNMIGILKALGLNNTAIRKVFLYNALQLIGIGLILGNLLGIGICAFQHYTHFFKLDESAYYISYIPIKIGPIEILLLNLGTAALCLLALLIPSGLVSRISPIKAIRFK
ncbi:ABC transporter permease [Olivibacter domesticus]|uniref:Lipoprotein-releasing system permease protein n=1 Tax=Olivibacter domesticus TaxID=407022 RepID=A0A1H7ILQ6_OLID1|nr:FtsX-like permease family protein [Olivibacter domesticus]SEK63473.1 lipoprotein-releasing system permease protein [Olivibacter domesticus]